MHRYGVFICYEAVFADEVRQFARNGAQVLVNISDDGWYGDTSAPWQHLNMARMRAIENRRWLLRDTNNGVTAVHRSLRPRPPEHSPPPGRRPPRPVRLPRRHHLLHRPRRRLRLGLCHTFYRGDRLVPPQAACIPLTCGPADSLTRYRKSGLKSKPWHPYTISNSPTLPCATRCATCGSIFDPARLRRELSRNRKEASRPGVVDELRREPAFDARPQAP